MKKKKNRKLEFFPIVGWCLATFWVVVFLTFLAWMGFTSLKSVFDFKFNPLWLPREEYGGVQFRNYALAFDAIKIVKQGVTYRAWDMIGNSVFYAFGKALCAIIPPCLVAYLVAKYNYIPIVAAMWTVVLLYKYVPISASAASCLAMMKTLGLYDSMWGIFLWTLSGFGGSFMLLYATWKNVSTEYRDAAFIDGAGHFRALITVMLPMVFSLLAILFVLNFIGCWNDYVGPMMYLPSYPTLSYGAWTFQFSTANPEIAITPVQMAGLYTLSLPMLFLFILLRKRIMNMSVGVTGLKG